MAKFKKGDAVRQVVPAPIEGVVEGYHVDQITGDIQILVTWAEDEEVKSRYFTEAQLEELAVDPVEVT